MSTETRRRKRDLDPRHHRGDVSFSQKAATTMKVWSYGSEYHVAFVGPDGHTICQGKFRTRRGALEGR